MQFKTSPVSSRRLCTSGVISHMMQYGFLPDYANALGATPDIDHYNSPYKATVSQLIWEQVIKFGMDYSLLRVATVNKIANAACEPALKCLKLYQKLKADNIMVSIDKYWTPDRKSPLIPH